MTKTEALILETSVGRTRVCPVLFQYVWASQRGERRQYAHCLQRRINETGESKKGAILFVATFTYKASFEIPKFFNKIITLPKFRSGQLRFLG